MELNEYQKQAMTTCMPSCDNFSYMMLNLVGEVGEFSSKVAKLIRKDEAFIDESKLYIKRHSSMGGRKADLEAAKELYDFICKNVNLPDVRPNPADGLVEFAKKYIEKLAKDKGVDL